MENTASVSESSIEMNTTIMVSSYEEDSEYFSHKSIITQRVFFTQKYHHSKHGIHNCYINFSPTMKTLYIVIYIYIILYIYLYYVILHYCYIILYIKLKGM